MPNLRLLSPLASGADQLAARLALARGWALDVVLPTSLDRHDTGQTDEAARDYRALLGQAGRVLELPGRADDPSAFEMAGRATVAHSDLLLAIWDGQPSRGRGGTAEIVELALGRGTPVIHLPAAGGNPRLIWSALDPVILTNMGNSDVMPELDRPLLDRVLTALLAPPANPIEREFLLRFLNERPRRRQWRIEYPLMMMVAGVRRVRRGDLSAGPGTASRQRDWLGYREACVGCHGVDLGLDRLESGFATADALATHFAQTFRSSHVFNFILAALGTLLALVGLVNQGPPMPLALAEMVVIGGVVINTLTGARRCWHQRWLDYRQLAERLRPMRSLKLLGIAAPDPPGNAAEPVARRWLDWYAAAIWRGLGIPSGRLEPQAVGPLVRAIRRCELEPQIAYNRANASLVQRLDERLEALALSLFVAALVITVGTVATLLFAPELVARHGLTLTILSAGLPALGTAIFGIRVQGDHGALAARSRTTAALLERIAAEMGAGPTLPRAADLTEQAARVMLADLGEWRLVNELHELSLA